MMTILEKVDVLRRTEVLRQIRTESLARVAAMAREREHQPQEALYAENHAADRFFVVTHGEVALLRSGTEHERRGPSSVLGILGALSEGPYRETAMALTPVHTLQIDQQDLLDLMDTDSHISRGILKGLITHFNSR